MRVLRSIVACSGISRLVYLLLRSPEEFPIEGMEAIQAKTGHNAANMDHYSRFLTTYFIPLGDVAAGKEVLKVGDDDFEGLEIPELGEVG